MTEADFLSTLPCREDISLSLRDASLMVSIMGREVSMLFLNPDDDRLAEDDRLLRDRLRRPAPRDRLRLALRDFRSVVVVLDGSSDGSPALDASLVRDTDRLLDERLRLLVVASPASLIGFRGGTGASSPRVEVSRRLALDLRAFFGSEGSFVLLLLLLECLSSCNRDRISPESEDEMLLVSLLVRLILESVL